MRKVLFVVLCFLLLTCRVTVFAQSVRMPIEEMSYHTIDRYSIKNSKVVPFNTSIKPYQRKNLVELISRNDSFEVIDVLHREEDWIGKDNWDYARYGTNWQRPKKILKYFYTYSNAWFSVNQSDFKLIVNPVLSFNGGQDFGSSETTFRNTRGGEMRGMIGSKVGFYSIITENQFRFPTYYQQQIIDKGVVPGAGFHKKFGSKSSDFLNARGYISFNPIDPINIQFGHDRNFIGDGYRSLILSDYAKEYLFLKFQTQVWRLNYMNLFSEHVDFDRLTGAGTGTQKKYEALHYLNIELVKGVFNLGLFERIVFSRQDSNQAPGFELNYLNPIIFYRSVEHGLNSSDNAILGLDWKLNLKQTFQYYGQLVLDEFKKDELINHPDWWANKWAVQMGVKYIDAFKIKNFDIQLESNWVRPFTYTHSKKSQNVIHFNQPLAHPMGANFKEYLAILRYRPIPKMELSLKYLSIRHGADTNRFNTTAYGGNIYKNNNHRKGNYGYHFFDGIERNIRILDFTVSYEIFHKAYFDIRYVYRNETAAKPLPSWSNQVLSFGYRMNIGKRNYDI